MKSRREKPCAAAWSESKFVICATSFESVQVVFLITWLIAHVFPGTALIIHICSDRNLQFSFTGELIAQQRLTGAAVVMLFGHMNLLHTVRNKSFSYRPRITKGARFRATKSIPLQIRNKKSASPFRTHRWSECRDSNPRPLGPEPSAIPNFATPRQPVYYTGLYLDCQEGMWLLHEKTVSYAACVFFARVIC